MRTPSAQARTSRDAAPSRMPRGNAAADNDRSTATGARLPPPPPRRRVSRDATLRTDRTTGTDTCVRLLLVDDLACVARRHLRGVALFVATVAACWLQVAAAETLEWVGGASASTSVYEPDNWSPAQAPTAGDDLIVNVSAANTAPGSCQCNGQGAGMPTNAAAQERRRMLPVTPACMNTDTVCRLTLFVLLDGDLPGMTTAKTAARLACQCAPAGAAWRRPRPQRRVATAGRIAHFRRDIERLGSGHEHNGDSDAARRD